jgi:hypothetical protein
LLVAAQPFDALRVEGERAQIETVRQSSESLSDCERLAARIAHLQEILAWVDAVPSPPGGETNRAWQTLVDMRRVAHRILADQADPQAGDRTRSVVDPDARRGKHGEYYDGYLLDILIDADSELITQINVLPANGDEAADAGELIRREEQAHGNDIQQLSIDGIGFNGPVLRELTDSSGLALDVCVPPKAEACNGRFRPDDFVEPPQQGGVTCPAGEVSRYRQRDAKKQTTVYRFACETCAGCALLNQCMAKPPGHFGRTVRKNDYQAEYQRAREKAATPQYAQTRKEHPKVERKLSELTLRHGARRARSRGHPRVLSQGLITAAVTNVKRIVRLLSAPNMAAAYG